MIDDLYFSMKSVFMKYVLLAVVFFVLLLQFRMDSDISLMPQEVTATGTAEKNLSWNFEGSGAFDERNAYYCETDADCVIQEYDFCCLQEWRYLRGCFRDGYVSVHNLSCEASTTCMRTGEPYDCLCQNNRCVGVFDTSNRIINVSSSLGWG